MMTKASPQLQALATDFTEFAQEQLKKNPAVLDTLLSLGVSRDAIEHYKLGYNPVCYCQTVEGKEVTFFDGITIPIIDHYSEFGQLVDVCCKPIDMKEHSLYIFGSSFPMFETRRGKAIGNTAFVIVEEPMDAIMLESQLDESLNARAMALGRADRRIRDIILKARLAEGQHVLVALNRTLASDEFSNRLIQDLGGKGQASLLRPILRSPLIDWIAGSHINAWVKWALIGQGFNIPDPDEIEAEADSEEQWLSEFEAELETNEEFYSRVAPDLL